MKSLFVLSVIASLMSVSYASGGPREIEKDSKYLSYKKSTYEADKKIEQIPNNRSDRLVFDRLISKLSNHEAHEIKNNKSDYLRR